MYSYLIINIFVVIIPILLFFFNFINLRRNRLAFLGSIFPIGIFFIIWDSLATKNGNWGFNSQFILNFYILNLPLEEILFFITVPFSCIVIFEIFNNKVKEKTFFFKWNYLYVIIGIMMISSIIFFKQNYTRNVLLATTISLIIILVLNRSILKSRNFWASIVFCLIPFIIVNTILTAPPIVFYNTNDIWNIRIITFPLEDFFYSFSLLALNFCLYDYIKVKYITRNNEKR